jgi:protein phosphatase
MASGSDIGSVRKNNEDSIIIDAGLGLALVADGMGGHNAGEVASKMTSELIHAALASHVAAHGLAALDLSTERQRVLQQAIQNANARMLSLAQSDENFHGMGSTLALVLFRNDQLTIAHIGDSRMYRLRDGTLEQLTVDHTRVQQQLQSGLLTLDQAGKANNRHWLTRALGVMPVVAPDMREENLQAGDRYLLCSDGLSDHVPLLTMQAILSRTGAGQAEQCRLLLAAANGMGGDDNISVVLIDIANAENSAWSRLQKLIDSCFNKMKKGA